MTFKDIAYKNFKQNMKRYGAYFLCNTFTIMLFFIYSTLLFNPSFQQGLQDQSIKGTIFLSLAGIGVFSLFFVNYAHTSFINSRHKEFGLFLTLGMTPREIANMSRIENVIIVAASLGAGLLSGTIFSRLLFLIVINLMGLIGVNFMLNIKSYMLTIIVFIVVFGFMSIRSRKIINKMEIIDLIKDARKEKGIKSRPALGILGAVILVVSFFLMYIMEQYVNKFDIRILFVTIVILCGLGLYYSITQFGNIVMNLFKKNEQKYYKSIITVTEIKRKFSQYSKLVFVSTVLSTLIVIFMGISFFAFFQISHIGELNAPQDLMYIEDLKSQKSMKDEINSSIEKMNVKVHKEFEFTRLAASIVYEGVSYEEKYAVTSNGEYLKNYGGSLVLKGNEAAIITVKDTSSFNGAFNLHTLQSEKDYEFTLKKIITKPDIPINGKNGYVDQQVIVVSNSRYDQIKNEIHQDEVKVLHAFNFMEQLSDNSQIIKTLSKYKENGIVTFKSKYTVSQGIKEVTSFQLFIVGFLGFLFFIASGAVLYFKLFNEIEETKQKYKQLYKIGITEKEIITSIAKELRLLFYIPALVGSAVGFASLAILTKSTELYRQVLIDTFIVILIYVAFQTVFYFITKSKHVEEVIENI